MPGFFHDRKEAGKSAGTRETVVLSGRKVSYELERKQVKNINLRIRPDGSIHVSASKHHTKKQIEALFAVNEKMIFHSLERSEQLRERASSIPQFSRGTEGKLCEAVVSSLCSRYYPFFEACCKGEMPEIRYRRMKSRWGSCAPKTGVLTFNTRLAYVPEKCTEYVVVHEFCHFLYPNHSARFYDAVAAFLPDWKSRREELRKFEGLMT